MSEAHTNKTILGPDCRISGELVLENDAVIMGHFRGTLRVSGMLELTESAEVAGTIIVGTLRLAGRAEADVVAEGGVELLPGAQLNGQLFTSRVNVAEGAAFQGEVCVGPKAMDAATEAFATDESRDGGPSTEQAMIKSLTSAQRKEQVEQEPAPPVKTVPTSVNAVLQRRRPKVLSPRPSMISSGNNQPQ